MEDEKKSPVTEADLAKDGYREQYGIIVICKDEKEQKKLYEIFHSNGYECRVVVT